MPPVSLLDVAKFAEPLFSASHGERGKLVEQACATLQLSKGQFYRKLAQVKPADRQKRADANQLQLPQSEAEEISAYLMDGFRANHKRMIALDTAVQVLRANGRIKAETVDPKTGEVKPLSISAIRRAMDTYVLSTKQLRKPTPHVRLKSKHPNHVWQVDGSVCVLYYLPGGGCDLVELDQAVHYKNKPENLKAIEKFRVIRYVVTDHCTNVTVWRYYPHAESAEHTCRFLAWTMAPKSDPQRFPFHGRPLILMVDPGATAGGLVKRFCDHLGCELIVHQARRPRANGSVENGQNRVECAFESGLRMHRLQIKDFEDLNAEAEQFQCWYNATAVHSRHRMTRFGAWMHIRAGELITTGPADKLLLLATHEPEKRTVSGNLTVGFKSRLWNVSEVPGVLIGEKLDIHWHPFHTNTAMAIIVDDLGNEVHHALPDITGTVDPYNQQWGFPEDAVPIGERMESRPDTQADTNRKLTAKLSTGEQTLEATEKKRRSPDYTPFNGQIDPYKEAREVKLPDWLEKQGTALQVATPTMECLKLPHAQAFMRLVKALGRGLKPGEQKFLKKRYPDGIPEDSISQLAENLSVGCAEGSEAYQPGKPNLHTV